MRTFTIFVALAIVCLAIPAAADVRALWEMGELDGSTVMQDSSIYGNDINVGNDSGLNGDWCWDDPGVFTAFDGANWTIAGKDLAFDDPGNTTLRSGMTGDVTVEFDINIQYGGNQACIVARNYSADYGVFTQEDTAGIWKLNYSSWSNVATVDVPYGWFNVYDTTLLNVNTWYHIKVTVERAVGVESGQQTDRVSFYVTDMANPTSSYIIGNNGGGGAADGTIDVMGYLTAPFNYGKYCQGKVDNLSIDISEPTPDPPGDVDFYHEFTPDTATLLLYHFNEGSGSVVQDAGDSWTDKYSIQYRGYDGNFAFGLDPAKSWAVGKFGAGLSTYYNGVDTNNGGIFVDQSDTAFPIEIGLQVGPEYNLTIEFWFNPQQADQTPKPIIAKGGGADFSVLWGNAPYVNNIAFGYYSTLVAGSWNTVVDTTPVTMNQWTHIAITVDRTTSTTEDEITFYQNGIQTYQVLAPATTGGDHDNLYMLSGYTGDFAHFVHAKLDEVRISKCIRPYAGLEPDPASDWKNPYTGADTCTIALYHFDETTGTVVNDSAPAGGVNNGATKGNTFDAMSSTDVVWTPFDRSMIFDGLSGQRIDVPDNNALDMLNQFTLEAWIKLDSWPQGSDFWMIASKINNFRLNVSPGGGLMAEGYNGGSPYGVSYSAAGSIPLGKWTHVAMVYDSPSEKNWTRLYINGKEVEYAVRDFWLPRLTTSFYPFMIAGSMGFYPYFEGQIDEVRLSDCARVFNPTALRIAGIARDLTDNITLTIEAAADGTIYFLIAGEDLLNRASWAMLMDFEGAIPNVEYIDTGVLATYNQMFYQAVTFEPTPQDYPAIAEKSITVDAVLSEWSGSDIVAVRDNFYKNYDNRSLPYIQQDMYAAYDTTDSGAFYFAFEVEEHSSSDVLELMFIDDAGDSTQRQIAFDKFGTVNFYEGDLNGIRVMQDTGGDTYNLADFQLAGGAISTTKNGTTWRGELKVPYAFIGATYSFGAGSEREIFFNRAAQADSRLGTTNPDEHFWVWYHNPEDDPAGPYSYHDPGVGVSR